MTFKGRYNKVPFEQYLIKKGEKKIRVIKICGNFVFFYDGSVIALKDGAEARIRAAHKGDASFSYGDWLDNNFGPASAFVKDNNIDKSELLEMQTEMLAAECPKINFYNVGIRTPENDLASPLPSLDGNGVDFSDPDFVRLPLCSIISNKDLDEVDPFIRQSGAYVMPNVVYHSWDYETRQVLIDSVFNSYDLGNFIASGVIRIRQDVLQLSNEEYSHIVHNSIAARACPSPKAALDFITTLPKRDFELLGLFLKFSHDINDKDFCFLQKQEDMSSLAHETRHLKNALYASARESNPAAGAISLMEEYKLIIDDERSAFFASGLYEINKYITAKDDKNDLCFTFQGDLLRHLSAFPSHKEKKAECLRLLDKEPVLLAKMIFKEWDTTAFAKYKEQFASQLMDFAATCPLSRPATAGKEYLLRRRLLLSFDITNPITKTHHRIDLSKHIPAPKIPLIDKQNLLMPAQEVIRLRRLERTAATNARMVDEAQLLALRSAAYNTVLQNNKIFANIDKNISKITITPHDVIHHLSLCHQRDRG